MYTCTYALSTSRVALDVSNPCIAFLAMSFIEQNACFGSDGKSESCNLSSRVKLDMNILAKKISMVTTYIKLHTHT